LEDGAGSGSDCEACWRDGFKVDDWSGKTGTVSRDQGKVIRIELMSRWVKKKAKTADKTQSQGSGLREKGEMTMLY